MKNLFSGLMIIGIIAVFSVSDVMANTKIQAKHSRKQKDRKAINCLYCHGAAGKANIAKKKGQNLVKLKRKAQCTGGGCHK